MITGKQIDRSRNCKRVSSLQDELGEGVVNDIDDEEAHGLTAEAALESCQEA